MVAQRGGERKSGEQLFEKKRVEGLGVRKKRERVSDLILKTV